MHNRETPYRLDIDGLRGVAVLAVVGYHYCGWLFRGGFIGVDVFFVISGYLLSSIIFADVMAEDFSFSEFYARRIRRILPALFVLLILSAAFAWLFLLPSDLILFGSSMLAASLSASNFYFWANTNYFDAPAAVTPLLHTWSLAVEEQFYILFPIFVYLIHRHLARYLRTILLAVAIASFVWSVADVRINPGAAFFLPFTRAWELLLGSLLALRILTSPRSRIVRECLAAFGALGIIGSLFYMTSNTPYPGENALLACVGAAAIILAGENGATAIGSLLSRKPLVFIGLISYSLYLWHWPLLVFSRIAIFRGPNAPVGHLLLAAISVLIAAASWRFVEIPFRRGPLRPSKRTTLILGAACLPVLTGLAVLFSATRGMPDRFPSSANSIADYLQYGQTHPDEFRRIWGPGTCYLDRREPIAKFNEQICLSNSTGVPQVLIFGDSHAANLRSGLESSFRDVHFLQATSSSCPPTLMQNGGRTPECKRFVDKVINEYIPQKKVAIVLLEAYWNVGDLDHLASTVDLLRKRGVFVIVFGPFPVYDAALPRLLIRSIVNGGKDPAEKHLLPEERVLDERMSKMAIEGWHVPYVSPMKTLCPESGCVEYVASNIPLEFDDSHLTLQGSEYLGHEIEKQSPHIFDSQPERQYLLRSNAKARTAATSLSMLDSQR